jgi:hypothetical protein
MSKYLTGLVGLALILFVFSSADALDERPVQALEFERVRVWGVVLSGSVGNSEFPVDGVPNPH